MIRNKHLSLQIICLALILFLVNVSHAQDQSKASPCSAPEARQFDFWVGEWELSWPAEQWSGQPGEKGRGTNSITQVLDKCIIQEDFRFEAQNFNGKSLSVYNPKKGIWQQTWVDNQGGYLLFTGEYKDNKMELRTSPAERNGKTFISRMVFKNIKQNSLDWDWQRSDDGGKTWQDVWNIHYERKLTSELTTN